jgi:hypothetical protein
MPRLLIERRILKLFAVGAAHFTVMLVEPQHDLDFRRELPDDGVKPAPSMHELGAAGDDRVDNDLLAAFADRLDDPILYQITAHRHE